MSADSFVAFYGVRYEISIDESEDTGDSRIQAARKNGLHHYTGNFGGLDERYLMFIGTRIGILGIENRSEAIVSSHEVRAIMESTEAKLRAAGLPGDASLYLQWQPDV